MSYARFGCDGSDVYIFLSDQGLECCLCGLQKYEWEDMPDRPIFGGVLRTVEEVPHVFQTTAEMIAHLEAHQLAGHEVPSHTFSDLLEDAEENEYFLRTGEWLNGA